MREGEPFVIQFYKNPRHLHWRLDHRWLGEDEFGIWSAGLSGDLIQKGLEAARSRQKPALCLTPPGAWWVASWVPDHEKSTLFVDVTSPVEIGNGRAEMVDLDLDVVQARDGTLYIEDEDEFEHHQVLLDYPAEWIRQAVAVTDEVMLAIEANHEPFASVWLAWFQRALSLP
ncbi:MAG: YgaC family protein [Acidimicrobiia bacterium]|nr:YgaC family protein [Acidimicrobiia bacterium]